MGQENYEKQHLAKIQKALQAKRIEFSYVEEDGCASIDFQFRGLRYHIWEFEDEGEWGVETNVYIAGRSQEILGDYDEEISQLILGWPEMIVTK